MQSPTQLSQTQFLDLYRAGLSTATDVMKATLQNAERLQNQQLQLLRQALEESSRSADQLSQVHTLDELMAYQTRIAGTQLEKTMEYWASLWRAASDNQMALIGQVQSQMGQMRDQMSSATHNLRDAGRESEKRSERKSA
jgi:phasin family protein